MSYRMKQKPPQQRREEAMADIEKLKREIAEYMTYVRAVRKKLDIATQRHDRAIRSLRRIR